MIVSTLSTPCETLLSMPPSLVGALRAVRREEVVRPLEKRGLLRLGVVAVGDYGGLLVTEHGEAVLEVADEVGK